MDGQKQDFIDRYILNDMTVDEQQKFEEQLSEDTELQEQYEFTRKAVTALKSRNRKLKMMKEWEGNLAEEIVAMAQEKRVACCCPAGVLQRAEEECDVPVANKRSKIRYWIAGIASVAAVVMFGYILLTPSAMEMPAIQMERYEGFRGGGITQIATLIEEKRYDEALVLIEHEEKELLGNGDSHNMDEQRKYMYENMQQLKVYVLVGLNRKEEVLELLNRMRQEKGLYQEWADSMYQEWN